MSARESGKEEGLLSAVAAQRDELTALAQALIRFDTTARDPEDPPREEAALQALLADRLRRAGAEVDVFEPASDAIAPWQRQIGTDRLSFAGRPQLIARWPGNSGGRSLILNGHIDAVSVEPRSAWSVDPFAGEISGSRLIGRGACDMKGGVAAMVIAAETVVAELGPLAGDLIVNTVTDEESSGAGVLACLAHGLDGDAVIVPEPSGFDTWVACRGSVTPTVTVHGRPGHAELPQPPWQEGGAVNAIEKLQIVVAAVAELRQHWLERSDQRHPHLAPGTVVPVLVSGGEWFVSYPARARLTCELMYLPTAADEHGEGRAVEREFIEWIRAATEADPWLREHPPEVSWGSDIPPAEIPGDHPLAATVLAAAARAGAAGAVGGFNSWHDGASFIRVKDIPAVAFGPPQTADAHVVDEGVEIDDLVTCAQALALAAVEWCGM